MGNAGAVVASGWSQFCADDGSSSVLVEAQKTDSTPMRSTKDVFLPMQIGSIRDLHADRINRWAKDDIDLQWSQAAEALPEGFEISAIAPPLDYIADLPDGNVVKNLGSVNELLMPNVSVDVDGITHYRLGHTAFDADSSLFCPAFTLSD
eukprot:TRINITY_DN107728_c0_g1_i1.p1 TRINITY_DN107728_c0_g1~~TRINITY_DN107728_c0_g1_i1.p1  ORF type:complete len:150 (-),score=25.34 TRINITY_DN107728_c0_g1_i1:125-574(-)